MGFLSAGFCGAQTVSDADLFRQISSQCSFNGQSINAACVTGYRDKLEYLFFQGNIGVPDKMEIGRQLLYSYGPSPADQTAFRAVAHRYSEYHSGSYSGHSDDAGAAAGPGSSHAWMEFAEVDGECDIHGSVVNGGCILAHRGVLEELFYKSDLDLPDKIAIGRKLAQSYGSSADDAQARTTLAQQMSSYQEQAAKHAYSRAPDMSSVVYGDVSATEARRPPTLYSGSESAPGGNHSARGKTAAPSSLAAKISTPVPVTAASSPMASTPAPTTGSSALTAEPSLKTTQFNSPATAPNPVRTTAVSAPAASTRAPMTVGAGAPSTAAQAGLTSSTASSVQLTANVSAVKTVAVSSPPSPSPVSASAAPVPGATRGLIASNNPTAHLVAAGSSYALIIGIDEYPNFPKLNTAVGDARAVEAELRGKYGFHTQLLLDAQADRAHIMTALSSFRRTLSPDSNLLVYYAGHGLHDRESDKVYWLPVDAEPDNSANWLQTDDVTSEIRAIPARHILIVADSCYAGGMTRDAQALFTPMERSRFLEKVANAKSRDLLSSGGDEPVADAGGAGGHSVFAAALLRGLAQMDMDRFTAAELFSNYIRVIVAGNSEQTPEYNFIRNSGHDAGDFIFARQAP